MQVNKVQQEYFGVGAIERLTAILQQQNPQNIFLVCGKKSYRCSGAEDKISYLLLPYKTTKFTDFSPNVKINDVKKGLAAFKLNQCDFVLAVGGGSTIDLAKTVAILSANPGRPEEYIQKKMPIQPRMIPLAVVPTTAGTGSEATHFAVVYLGKDKYSLAHFSMVPDFALIDPNLTISLLPYETACTGIDALAQAIESSWSVQSTKESKNYAEEAIILAKEYLEKAVKDPNNIEARVGMARAANLAGKAINISFTTACHAISYPITSYFNIPHGHAVALTLPEMITYNAKVTEKDCLDKRKVEYVQRTMQELYAIVGAKSGEEMKKKIETLLENIGLEQRLQKLNIHKDDVEIIIKRGFNPERMKNNPRLVTEGNLRNMLFRLK